MPKLGNLGYALIGKETTPGVAVTPTIALPLYDETLTTNTNLVDLNPIAGNKAARQGLAQGVRDHKGDLTLQAEPNTTALLLDSLLTKQSTTNNGNGTYTHVFKLDTATDPHSYTVDIGMGNNLVARFVGLQLSKLAEEYNKTEGRWKGSASALSSFYGREVASISGTGTGPYTITFTTTYDPNPTNGLVVGDLITFMTSATGVTNTAANGTVATIVNGTQITTTGVNLTTAAVGAGDICHLRVQTVTSAWLAPFLWTRLNYFVAATAAAAVTASATVTNQTRFETGSVMAIEHKFEKDSGSDRSGGFDPAALIRTLGDLTLKTKRIFDTPDQMKYYMSLVKTAFYIVHNAGPNYSLAVTVNNAIIKQGVKPQLKSDSILYSDIEYLVSQDATDGQMFSVAVTNTLTTV